MSVENYFSEMPKYSRFFRKMPVNASGMDFTHKCRHLSNPAVTKKLCLCINGLRMNGSGSDIIF